MKKKVITNAEKQTREAHFYSPVNKSESHNLSSSVLSERIIEKYQGFWKITSKKK